jgi:predicted acetyltransferase
MRFQLADAKARGEIVATLYASESAIYGRFGYGIASYARVLKLRGARVRPEVPRAGQVRLLTDVAEALAVVPGLYERIGLHRPGMMSRGPDWWVRLAGNSSGAAIVHTGPDGDDGFALYTVESMDNPAEPDHDNRLTVLDLHAANTGAFNDLWRFVLGVDLIGEVRVHNRPLDEHVELLLVDSRKCRTDDVGDELWARLVDVPEALAARSYGDAEPVVIKVNDQFLPDNSGTYGISPFGATRVSGDPALVLDVDVLAMIYLGAVKPSGLAAAGRLQVIDPDAVARADKLFASDQIAWCGTGF